MIEESKETTSGVAEELQELIRALYLGNAQKAKETTELVLQHGYSADYVIENALLPSMHELGKQLTDGTIYIPEVLMSSRAMQGAMYALQPVMVHTRIPIQGTVVIGTVAGDYHDIGKNLVAMMLRTTGFAVVDLGNDVTAATFLEAVKRHKPDIVGISALLTTTMMEMKTVIDAITAEGLRSQVTIMIGGAPVTKEFAHAIKADIYAENMFKAREVAVEFTKHRNSQQVV